MMEDWNIGFECVTPIFHYSNIPGSLDYPFLVHYSIIPLFQSSLTLTLQFILLPWRPREDDGSEDRRLAESELLPEVTADCRAVALALEV